MVPTYELGTFSFHNRDYIYAYFRNQILFLNKEDLFKSKIAESPIRRFFPDYEGPSGDVEAGKQYFQKRFLRIEHKGTLQLQQLAKSGDLKTPSNQSHGAMRRQIYPQ